MLIVKIKAGLGNQMFQYAFGRALSLERKEKLFLDISYYQNQPKRDAKRTFILDAFGIQADITSEELSRKFNTKFKIFLRKLYRRIKKINDYTFYPSLLRSRSSYYEGTWINEKYFLKYADEIRGELSLKNPFGDAAKKIPLELSACKTNGEESVSLHIRRGDFVSSPQAAFNGVLGVPYYQKAVDVLVTQYHKKNIRVFVFSDDIAWAKENLKLLQFSAIDLLSLINNVLDFNKIESGKLDLEEADFSVKKLLEECRASIWSSERASE